MESPDRTTAAAFPKYANGQVIADSSVLNWPDLYARLFRFPQVVDTFLVPATPEPLISCVIRGSAELQERDPGGEWIKRQLEPGDIFVTRSRSPYELRCRSLPGQEIYFIIIHLGIEPYLTALETAFPGQAGEVDVIDFFGRDEALAHLCRACAEMLATRVPGTRNASVDSWSC